MGLMAGVGGLVGGLSGLFGGGGANSVQLPPMFTMPNMGAAANNAFSGIGNISPFTNSGYNMINPSNTAFGTLFNNTGAGNLTSGANTAMGMGQNAAMGAYGTGGALTGMGFGLGNTLGGIGASVYGTGAGALGQISPLMQNAGTVMNTAMDPQSQLYSMLQQQNTQQSQANAMAAGLGTSPYGVSLTDLSNQQFNVNWQNQQLGRQESGLQAYTGAANTAGGLYNTGGNLMLGGGQLMGQGGQIAGNLANMGTGIQNAAPGQYLTASSYPFGAQSTIGAGQQQGISGYFGNMGSAANLGNIPVSDYLSYLGTGNQANATANQTAALGLQQQQQNFNQQMLLGGMLGGSLYGMGNAMGFGGGNTMLGSMLNGSFGMPNFVNQSFVNGSPGTPSYTPLQQSILAGYG